MVYYSILEYIIYDDTLYAYMINHSILCIGRTKVLTCWTCLVLRRLAE